MCVPPPKFHVRAPFQPEGSVLRDRFKSLQKRSLIEPRERAKCVGGERILGRGGDLGGGGGLPAPQIGGGA